MDLRSKDGERGTTDEQGPRSVDGAPCSQVGATGGRRDGVATACCSVLVVVTLGVLVLVLVVVLVLGALHLHLGADLVHVQPLDCLDDLLQ